jgi:hypothetical protein
MTRRSAVPWRRLAPLAIAVLAVHGVLLGIAWNEQVQAPHPAARAFDTRTVVAAAPVAAPVQVAAPAPVPEPAPAPTHPRHAQQATPAPAEHLPRATPAPAPVAPKPDAPRNEPVRREASAEPPAAPAAPAASAASPAVPALALLAPARLRYAVTAQRSGFSLSGEAELRWRHDGQQYEAQLEVRSPLLPTRMQRSTGRITPEGLAPTTFVDKARNEQATHFDRAGGRLIFSNNQPGVPITAGMQDRLSVVLQLVAMVAGDPARYPPGTDILVPTASTKEAEPWVFNVENEEDLRLPGGTVRALKLHRRPRKPYDQTVELWLAPRMDYAPVRIRLTNANGDTVDQRWSSTDKG